MGPAQPRMTGKHGPRHGPVAGQSRPRPGAGSSVRTTGKQLLAQRPIARLSGPLASWSPRPKWSRSQTRPRWRERRRRQRVPGPTSPIPASSRRSPAKAEVGLARRPRDAGLRRRPVPRRPGGSGAGRGRREEDRLQVCPSPRPSAPASRATSASVTVSVNETTKATREGTRGLTDGGLTGKLSLARSLRGASWVRGRLVQCPLSKRPNPEARRADQNEDSEHE